MYLNDILNEANNSFIYQHKTSFKSRSKVLSRNLLFHQFTSKPKIIEIKEKPKTNQKVLFGFWNNPNYIEKIEIIEEIKEVIPIKIKEIESYSKFQFLTDPYLDHQDEKEIIKSSPVIEKIEYDINGNIESRIDFSFLEDLQENTYSNNDLILMLNYNNKNNRLFDIINTYDNYVSKHNDKNEILKELSYNILKSRLSEKKLSHWIENFPNLIDNKIKALKKSIKPKNQKLSDAKKKEYYNPKVTELRYKTVYRMLESRGYYSVNSDIVWERISELHKSRNLDIVNDIIKSLDDQYGNDNDMIEFNENKLFQEHIKECEERYKYHE